MAQGQHGSERERKQTKWPRSNVPSRKSQLRWIQRRLDNELRDTLESNPNKNYNQLSLPSQNLLDAMKALAGARTPQQIISVGGNIEQILKVNRDENKAPFSTSVLDSAARAAAMAGLLHLAMQITDDLIAAGEIPSEACQDTFCQSCRTLGKLQKIETFLLQVGKASAARSDTIQAGPGVSVVSYNTFLAALCGPIVDKKIDRTFWTRTNPQHALQHAASWLNITKTNTLLGMQPDAISYATVLNAASEVGNASLANHVWEQSQATKPRIDLYNARLKGLRDDEHILRMWDHVTQNTTLVPDRYTIDYALLPLLRAGRVGDIEAALEKFIARNSVTVVANAFEAFLWTLVREDVAAARAILDMYVQPALSPVVTGTSMRLVQPRTRHYNVVLEGYKKQYEEENKFVNVTKKIDARSYREAWELYKLMLQSHHTHPDSYTVTTMMALCQSSSELTDFIDQAMNQMGINLTAAVLRSAVTSFGALGDASSACRLFQEFTDASPSERYWNVLLKAIVSSMENQEVSSNITMGTCEVNRILKRDRHSDHCSLVENLDGLPKWEAIVKIVNCFCHGHPKSQAFCLMAKGAALAQKSGNATRALEIFRNASANGVPADGRFLNAVIRCFGTDVDAAVNSWKNELRRACLLHETRTRSHPVSPNRVKGKNLIAAYHGLLFVCGRSLRPDIALRLVYAMSKEGLEVNENALNCYRAGKRIANDDGQSHAASEGTHGPLRRRVGRKLGKLLKMADAYESILYVECVKYNKNDKRRAGEKRIRIIL